MLVFGRRRVAAMERFDFRLFSRTKDRPPPGTYAMWWVTPEDSNLRSSPTIASIDRVYQAVHGYASCFLALILEALGTAHPGETRVPLPKNPISPLWRGPENRLYPVSISEEKGIRFYLPLSTTTVRFREEFWRLFAEFAERKRSAFVDARLPEDAPSLEYPGGPPDWWEAAKSLFERLERREGGPSPNASLGTYIVQEED